MPRYTSSVSPKGQVTIPIEIREHFGIEPKDSVTFEVIDGRITMAPLRARLHDSHQRFKSRLGSLDWKTVEKIAWEEVAMNAAREGLYDESEQK